MKHYRIDINESDVAITSDADVPLLYILRDQLNLNSVRYGCGNEHCGSCRVLIDGKPAYSCTTTIDECEGHQIRTVEGLVSAGKLHPLQQAFLDFNAGQCGYCLSGILMTATHLLEQNPQPSRDEIQTALAPHLCRCGAHNRIIAAIESAARMITGGNGDEK